MAKICFPIVFSFLVALHLGSNSVKALIDNIEDGDSLFDASNLNSEDYEMPAACEGKTFCFEKGDNYPDEKIEQLLADMRQLKVDDPEAKTIIGDRKKRESKSPSYDEVECPSNSTESPLYYIRDDNDRVRVVVQAPNKFQQLFTVRQCLNEGPITRDTSHFLSSSRIMQMFALKCISTKFDYEFFVLSDEMDPHTNTPRMQIAKAKGGIPVCCSLRYSSKE